MTREPKSTNDSASVCTEKNDVDVIGQNKIRYSHLSLKHPSHLPPSINSIFSSKLERILLKAFLLERLHHLFWELCLHEMQYEKSNLTMECYVMDGKIVQFLIRSMVETGEYTLEGIAYYTHVPFDVIYEAACGINNHMSMTPWIRLISLYLQAKPEMIKIFLDKLLESREKNINLFSMLIDEK